VLHIYIYIYIYDISSLRVNLAIDVLFRDNIKHHHTNVKTEAQPTVHLKDYYYFQLRL